MQAKIPGIDVDEDEVDTNIVFFHITPDAKLTAAELVEQLNKDKGILVGGASSEEFVVCVCVCVCRWF